MPVARVKGELKVLPIHTCSQCGATATGSTATVEIDTSDPTDILFRLNRIKGTCHTMPVGWGSYAAGGMDLRCPKCH